MAVIDPSRLASLQAGTAAKMNFLAQLPERVRPLVHVEVLEDAYNLMLTVAFFRVDPLTKKPGSVLARFHTPRPIDEAGSLLIPDDTLALICAVV